MGIFYQQGMWLFTFQERLLSKFWNAAWLLMLDFASCCVASDFAEVCAYPHAQI